MSSGLLFSGDWDIIEKMENMRKIRVVCAMSGGVDSAVSAALLVRAGFEVVGVFMKFWVDRVESPRDSLAPTPAWELSSHTDCLPQNRCCSTESEQRARRTAQQLGIPFFVLDVKEEFKKSVVDEFIADAKKGLTPNPCVVCNQKIKFGLLIEKARAMGADYVATGHYCRVKKTKDGVFHLFKGKDKNKDQSYFLWHLSQKQLGRVIFPVGCFEKNEVRQLAKKWKLPSASTPESQEVCFTNGDMDGFLEKYCGKNPGNIVDESGKTIGRQDGLWFYTIGQRKGIGLSGGPYFASGKNRRKNELVVVNSPEATRSRSVKLKNVRWCGGVQPQFPIKVKAKIRYRAKEAVSNIIFENGAFTLEFAAPQFAPTPGQSAVFYRGQELIGGGVIG